MKAPEFYVIRTLLVSVFSVVGIEGEFGTLLGSSIGVLFLMPSTPHWISLIG
jgi:hypothetical protein